MDLKLNGLEMQKFNCVISGEINKYDFVIVNISGWFTLGFFYKETSTTIQYLHMEALINKKKRGVLNYKKPYVNFIMKDYLAYRDTVQTAIHRIARYSPDLLCFELREKYYSAIEIIEAIKAHD